MCKVPRTGPSQRDHPRITWQALWNHLLNYHYCHFTDEETEEIGAKWPPKDTGRTPLSWVWAQTGWLQLEKGMATHSNILAWRIPWTEEPGGLQSMGFQRLGHDWACTHARIVCTNRWCQTIRDETPFPKEFPNKFLLQCSSNQKLIRSHLTYDK